MSAFDKIQLAHGGGGRLTKNLIDSVFVPAFANDTLLALDDGAVVHDLRDSVNDDSRDDRLAFTTDGYVVKPIFFPGGDIGRLAICGTVNDLAMMGARPKYISAAFILEEGFPLDDLRRLVDSMQRAAAEAGVVVATGDTKVVRKGEADSLFITTAGIGAIPPGRRVSGSNAKPGDVVIVSGYMGDHGIAVMSSRQGLEFGTTVQSDVAPLSGLVETMFAASSEIRVLRDPTRGGLATTLNEIAKQSKVNVALYEKQIPIREGVAAACEMLGFDPLYVANEGKLIAVVAQTAAEAVVQAMRQHPLGRDAAIVGQVNESPSGTVHLKTAIGTTRILDMLSGEMLPRIC